ncbi:hypothetical protein [Leptospira wolffii]|uniref:hypothetical protein n=1 Tax=Leptospira wolffii TaxID=409998 RepID=UPI000315930B|nr:hypothetical protein [Leptospira wolffii]EPG65874.1 hypothetical protein LEP1GSC061_2098 [Leptospira wolffii serovar Khorat str. Khorat-H2]
MIGELTGLFTGLGGNVAEIYGRLSNFVNLIYSYNNSPLQGQPPFLQLAAFVLSLDAEKVDLKEIQDLSSDLKTKVTQANELIDSLRVEASKVTTATFAKIFGAEAEKYSSSKIEFVDLLKFWKNKFFGAAEKWLFFFSLNLIGIVIVILKFDIDYSLLIFDEYSFLEVLPDIFKKVAILAILLYLARFSLKNYGINKVLYTANSHRRNVLDSFRLLYDSIPSEDNGSKAKFLEEVARSIYTLGSNPYSSLNKDEKLSINALTEALKLVKK